VRNVFTHFFSEGITFTRYFRVRHNDASLTDQTWGFVWTENDKDFLDLSFSPYFSELEEDSGIILENIFETSEMAAVYEREVWNLEEALGKIGGFMSLVFSAFYFFVSIFTKD